MVRQARDASVVSVASVEDLIFMKLRIIGILSKISL